MKYNVLIILLFFVITAGAQITNEGEPVSWQISSKKSTTPVVMKGFDLDKIKAEDATNDLNKSKPWRFGYEHKVNLGLENSGVWDEVPNGRVWRINIVSKEAKTLNFVFDTYKIPRGASIYLYNNDRSDLLGAYTNIFNRPDEMLGTWMVEGENVWVEYYEPSEVRGQGQLNIAKVIHGYRSITNTGIRQKGLGDSGSCNQDVECTVGEDFDPLKESLKHSVAFIIMQGFVCTGTLINNTSNDKAPYFLTANHCNAGNESTWAFRFNWISPNPSCATTDSSPDATVNQTTSGATLRASNPESDFKLLNLDGGLDDSWELEWAGWDRTGDVPNFVVGIHHPSGDIMKVCRENNTLSVLKTPIAGIPDPVDSWEIGDWDIGVTEGGSSGSALFDASGRIVGQLAGGGAACNGTNDNNLPDYYGRFNVSWDFGNSDSTRLSNWLDPTNTGKEILDTFSEEMSNGTPPIEEEEITVFFDPFEAVVQVANGANKILEYTVYDMAGQQIISGQLSRDNETVEIPKGSSGMYFIYITDTSNGSSFTKKVILNGRF